MNDKRMDTASPEHVAWMAAVWKANEIRNQLLAQLQVCKNLEQSLK